jgi:hypothetical protein
MDTHILRDLYKLCFHFAVYYIYALLECNDQPSLLVRIFGLIG